MFCHKAADGLSGTRVLYLTPGCFDKGGISRYSRYQIRAWREIFGPANVRVFSVLGPDGESFEDPVATSFYAGSLRLFDKARYVGAVTHGALAGRPHLVVAAHVNLSGLAHVLARATGAVSALNVYGSEMWSGFRLDAKWGLEGIDHVVADCHFTARYVEASGHRPRGTIEVVWDCVDLDRFSPAAPDPHVLRRYAIPHPDTGFNLLTLGRMSGDAAHKGYDRLLTVFGRLAPRHPRLHLVFAGRGDLVQTLRARAASMGLADRVSFTGMVHERDLPDVYRSAHFFSLVSDRGPARGEGLPLTPLEASACGVPILVGDQDGSAEAVVDGRNGFVLDPFDLTAQASRITQLIENVPLRDSLARGAADVARELFSYQRFRDQHATLSHAWLKRRP